VQINHVIQEDADVQMLNLLAHSSVIVASLERTNGLKISEEISEISDEKE